MEIGEAKRVFRGPRDCKSEKEKKEHGQSQASFGHELKAVMAQEEWGGQGKSIRSFRGSHCFPALMCPYSLRTRKGKGKR